MRETSSVREQRPSTTTTPNLVSRRCAIVLLLGLVQIACADAATSSHSFEAHDENGVRIATTRGGPRYDENLLRLEPELTLIQDPDRPESLLYDATGFLAGPGGNLFVADSGNHRVAVFDSSGRYLHSFGREGQGPGEFSGGLQLQCLRQNVLQVFDIAGKRTHRFDLDGTLLETLRAPDKPRLRRLYQLPDGRRAAWFSDSDRRGETILRSAGVAVMSADGTRTLAQISTDLVPSLLIRATQLASGGVATVAASIPFAGQAEIVEISGRGFAVSAGNTSEIDEYDYDGTLVGKLRLPLDLVPVTEDMRRRYEQRWQQAMAQAEAQQSLPGEAPEMQYPETAGLFSAIYADDAGYLWLRDAAFIGEPGRWRYHLVDPDGRYLGTVLTPAGQFHIRGGRMFALVDDPQTGDPVATVFRLESRPTGFRYRQ